jgi:HEAT repeat protein
MVNVSFSRFLLTSFCTILFLTGCTLADASSRPLVAAPPTPTPTPLPTAMPLPSQTELKDRFASEVGPLLEKLQAAAGGSAVEFSAGDQIIYLPATETLYNIQSILQLTRPATQASGHRVYVFYNYYRGGWLGKAYKDRPSSYHQTDTQTIITSIRLVIEDQGKYILLEEKSGEGGEGSTTYRELVTKAVPSLEKLPVEVRASVEQDLEEIIGYACGIDMTAELDFFRRARMLSLSLTSPNWADKVQGIQSLLKLKPLPADTAAALYPILTDPDIGYQAGQVLARLMDDPIVFEKVAGFASSPVVELRTRTAEILGAATSQPEAAIDPLIALIMDEDSSVRLAAGQGLGRRDDSLALERIVPFLENPNSITRQYAVDALGHFYSQAEEVAPKLAAMVADSSPGVRQSTANSLRFMGKNAVTALPALMAAAKKETDLEAFSVELSAIEMISSKTETLPLLKELLPVSTDKFRLAIITTLAYYTKTPGTTDLLLVGLKDKAVEVRTAAAESLATLIMLESGHPEAWPNEDARLALPALIQALGDNSPDVQSGAARALGYFGAEAKSSIPALIEAFQKDESYNSYAYNDALMKITGVETFETAEDWAAWWETEKNKP